MGGHQSSYSTGLEWFFRRRRNTLNEGANVKVAFRLLCITDLPREKLSLFHSLSALSFFSLYVAKGDALARSPALPTTTDTAQPRLW